MKDNLKTEINYMLRVHVLPLSGRRVNLPWQKEPLTVLSIDSLELFGAKIVALLNRTVARDLYDIFNLQKYGDESEETLLRRCVVFYSAIAACTDSVRGEKGSPLLVFSDLFRYSAAQRYQRS